MLFQSALSNSNYASSDFQVIRVIRPRGDREVEVKFVNHISKNIPRKRGFMGETGTV